MLMMSHYELHDDELAWWHSSLSESHRIARVRHELIAAMRYDQIANIWLENYLMNRKQYVELIIRHPACNLSNVVYLKVRS